MVSFTVETQNINKEENKRLIIESTEKDFFFSNWKEIKRWRKMEERESKWIKK